VSFYLKLFERKIHEFFHLFPRIMMSFSERIRIEAIDTFDNFIVQAVAPSAAELKGIHEHNRLIFRTLCLSLEF
jgi:hypothetical protein